MPSNIIPNVTGEMGDPINVKARRTHDRQGASGSGIGPTEQPGLPEATLQGKRKNGNLSTQMGGAPTPSSSPRVARRRRGVR